MVNHLRPVEPDYGVHKEAKDIVWPPTKPNNDVMEAVLILMGAGVVVMIAAYAVPIGTALGLV